MTPTAVRHPGEFRWETRLLAVVTLILTALGLASCLASGAYMEEWHREAVAQAYAAIVGGGLFLVAANVDYQIWRKIAVPALVVTLAGLIPIALVALALHGRTGPPIVNRFFPVLLGSRRWIRIGVQLQVSEVARFTVIAWLAMRVADLGPRLRDFKAGFVPVMGVLAGVTALIAIEPSVTVAGTLCLIGLIVLFVGGARIPHLLLVGVVALVAVAGVIKFDKVRAKRQASFQTADAIHCITDTQACQSLIGFGSGKILGVGFGRGTQKLGHLPEAYSDFLLSVFAEEWGLLGVIGLVACFVVFCWMGFRIALTARDPFGTLLAAGITTMVGFSAFVHAAVVTWLMPTTGLTLPFMSVGRLSLLMSLFSAGVLVSIGRQRGRPAREK